MLCLPLKYLFPLPNRSGHRFLQFVFSVIEDDVLVEIIKSVRSGCHRARLKEKEQSFRLVCAKSPTFRTPLTQVHVLMIRNAIQRNHVKGFVSIKCKAA